MRYNDIIYRRNLRHYARYYKLVALSVIVAVTVIVGSLIVGDSVRYTLRHQVEERLGDAESIIYAHQSYLEDDILALQLFGNEAQGFLLTQGFIAHNGRLLPVMVWGCDDEELDYGVAKINQPLYEELDNDTQSDVVLRLPAKGLIPSGSLFVTDNYTTSIRLKISSVKSAKEGGNMNLRNEQIQPLNIFISREELAEELGVEGRINIIFSNQTISTQQWHQAWRSDYSGLNISTHTGYTAITSSRIFLQPLLVETICRNNPSTNRLQSYLANHLRGKQANIPYSFVTAIDRYNGKKLADDEVILSDYSAQRLNVERGDFVTMSYFVADDLKNISSDSIKLRIVDIIPLEQLTQDKGLSANFPGLSDVDRCSEWDSDLPIDMDLITDEDEDYWNKYKHTPKAIVAYNAVEKAWSSDYGNATALRIDSPNNPNLDNLTPEMFGVQLLHPRADALIAANNGVDFSSLFLALGFFIVAAALLLMYTPLAEMYAQRQDEIQTMQMMGYTKRRLKRQLYKESAPIILTGAILGCVCGIVYTEVILWLLESVWKGATHTAAFTLSLRPLTLFGGSVIGISCSLGVVVQAVRSAINSSENDSPQRSDRVIVVKLTISSIALSLATIGLYIYCLSGAAPVMLSVANGCLAMLAITSIILMQIIRLHHNDLTQKHFTLERLTRSTLYAHRQQAVLSLLVLSFSVFTVFVVGLNRRSFDNLTNLQSSTGGYSLWCESSVALHHDPASQMGRKELGIDNEWDEQVKVLTFMRYGADDASCLNLNKVSEPTVLGVDFGTMAEDEFTLGRNIYKEESPKKIFAALQHHIADGVYPALVDATVLQWSLGKELGDTLYYRQEDGRQVAIVLAATLTGGLFQGNILIDKSLFKLSWPEQNGCNIFLVKTPDDTAKITHIKQILAQGLYEYGLRATTSAERLAMFNQVTDTYLSIFMTLGSIGLLLGIFSLVVVVRKTLTRNSQHTRQMILMGYSTSTLQDILYRENAFAPQYAIVIGIVGAIIGIGAQWRAVSAIIWLGAATIAIILLYLSRKFIRNEISRAVETAKNTLNKQEYKD